MPVWGVMPVGVGAVGEELPQEASRRAAAAVISEREQLDALMRRL
jgi:hypothetical protein